MYVCRRRRGPLHKAVPRPQQHASRVGPRDGCADVSGRRHVPRGCPLAQHERGERGTPSGTHPGVPPDHLRVRVQVHVGPEQPRVQRWNRALAQPRFSSKPYGPPCQPYAKPCDDAPTPTPGPHPHRVAHADAAGRRHACAAHGSEPSDDGHAGREPYDGSPRGHARPRANPPTGAASDGTRVSPLGPPRDDGGKPYGDRTPRDAPRWSPAKPYDDAARAVSQPYDDAAGAGAKPYDAEQRTPANRSDVAGVPRGPPHDAPPHARQPDDAADPARPAGAARHAAATTRDAATGAPRGRSPDAPLGVARGSGGLTDVGREAGERRPWRPAAHAGGNDCAGPTPAQHPHDGAARGIACTNLAVCPRVSCKRQRAHSKSRWPGVSLRVSCPGSRT